MKKRRKAQREERRAGYLRNRKAQRTGSAGKCGQNGQWRRGEFSKPGKCMSLPNNKGSQLKGLVSRVPKTSGFEPSQGFNYRESAWEIPGGGRARNEIEAQRRTLRAGGRHLVQETAFSVVHRLFLGAIDSSRIIWKEAPFDKVESHFPRRSAISTGVRLLIAIEVGVDDCVGTVVDAGIAVGVGFVDNNRQMRERLNFFDVEIFSSTFQDKLTILSNESGSKIFTSLRISSRSPPT
ncbi:hypothetical protein HHK36_007191 [Tetracentron sinense]|uniref:Uncharacterized protein n=1 Tax=Tetracentron sinense TaxID=13715 RepID=A0A834ZIG6_TETSI|nr:hypothetical protein HHK36_007191 [Tetracentron sinense]